MSSSIHFTSFRDNLRSQSLDLIGAKHSAFSTNHLADTHKTKHKYNQEQHKKPKQSNNKLPTYAQTESK